jgi:NAD(P)-dependent dehydrogenase (short-subunit alcohol dehydrogenase family)
LLLVSIENSSYSDPATAVEEVKAAGINYIDIVIANSGVSPGGAPLDAVDPKLVLDTINVNAIATVVLYQAVHKLLTASASPKWITVSSRAGSIGDAADFYYYVAPYGMSKAAVDWFTS